MAAAAARKDRSEPIGHSAEKRGGCGRLFGAREGQTEVPERVVGETRVLARQTAQRRLKLPGKEVDHERVVALAIVAPPPAGTKKRNTEREREKNTEG